MSEYVLSGRYTVALIDTGKKSQIAVVGDGSKIFRTLNNNVLEFCNFLVDNGCIKIEKVDDLIKVTFEIDESKVIENV